MRIAVTGHRPNKLGNEYDLIGPYSNHIFKKLQEVIDVYKHTQPYLLTGMALGVDMIWAKLAIMNNLPFIAYIPFKGQELKWPEKSQKLYYQLLSNAEEIIICSPGSYTLENTYVVAQKMQIRNQRMVDDSHLLVAVWDGTPGGTANCVNYATARKKAILRIDPKPQQHA